MLHLGAVAQLLGSDCFLGFRGEVVELCQHDYPGDVKSIWVDAGAPSIQIGPKLWSGDGGEVRSIAGRDRNSVSWVQDMLDTV